MWMLWLLIGIGVGLAISALVNATIHRLMILTEESRLPDEEPVPIMCTYCWSRPAVAFGAYRETAQSPLCADCAQKLGCILGGDDDRE